MYVILMPLTIDTMRACYVHNTPFSYTAHDAMPVVYHEDNTCNRVG